MRTTREELIELARREAEQRASREEVISGYLIGSVAFGEPFLGETADIDLILIHQDQPSTSREVVCLSSQVHLDIIHHPRDLYNQPRELRIHPWLGPSMCEPVFLYDPDHFFEWAQAGARGQFHRPDHVHARACSFLQKARQGKAVLKLSDRWLKTYTRITLEAANAAACLIGFPVAGRRLVLSLENAAKELGHHSVYNSFMHLLGGNNFHGWDFTNWVSSWARAYDAAIEVSNDPELVSCRRNYYLCGFQALSEAGRPEAVIWTLLATWEHVIHVLEAAGEGSPHKPSWEDFTSNLNLEPTSANSRSEDLDQYFDMIEEIVEQWAE